MVIAALAAFGSLLVAWIVAPSGERRRRRRPAPVASTELVPEGA